MVGSIAAALVAATMVAMCAAEPVRAESSAAIMLQDTPITALDAEKAGTEPPPPPYNPTVVKYVDPGMPTPGGIAFGAPFTNTDRCAWMWYASCSVAPHWIPSTVPVCVVPAGARSPPCSSATPSKPMLEADVEPVAPVAAAAVLELLAELELDELLEPQPASATAPARSAAVGTRERDRRHIDAQR